MDTAEIAKLLNEIAVLYELRGENPFKVRAYQNAARIAETWSGTLEEFVKNSTEKKIKGIGPQLASDIANLHRHGKLQFLEDLRASFPAGFLKLLNLAGLGPKKLLTLNKELGINNIQDLQKACEADEVASLKGFGEKTQEKFLQAIEQHKEYDSKFLFSVAIVAAQDIAESLGRQTNCLQLEIAGSLRRRKEITKDIDLVACASEPEKLIQAFTSLPQVKSVAAKGQTKASVVLENGINADLRVVEKGEFATALQHFTGSKEHNTALRARAKEYGLKLNEYGLFKGEKALQLKSEAEIFAALELAYIEPEMRENTGEIVAAEEAYKSNKPLDKLLTLDDVKGVLHVHTTYSDGAHSIRAMAEEAIRLGYEYIGISDHSKSAAYANGLKEAAIEKQHSEIDKLNKELAPFRIFKGIESDILADGELDYDDKVLASFDFVIASIHSRFSMSEEEMTKRILMAINNPFTTILGHPSGRLLLKRKAYQFDINAVLQTAAKKAVAIEINANPQRLDLDWRYVRAARDLGVKIPICPDAHAKEEIKNIEYGLGIARKGWLRKEDVLNCLSAKEIEKHFSSRRN